MIFNPSSQVYSSDGLRVGRKSDEVTVTQTFDYMNVRVVVASMIFASGANIVMSALKAERVKPKRLCAFVSWVVRAKAGAQSQDLALGCRWVCAYVSTHIMREHGEVQESTLDVYPQVSPCF